MVADESLEYEIHLALYKDFLSNDSEKDAYWHHKAEYLHALSVSDAIRDVHLSAVQLAHQLPSPEARLQLNFGVARRAKFIWLSLRHLLDLIPTDHDEPLTGDQVEESARNLNVIYINIRGVLDNFAWCLVDLFGGQQIREGPPTNVDLFGKAFRRDDSLQEVSDFARGFADWNKELKSRRDPAAHRIPLSVPPALLNRQEQEEYRQLSAAHTEALNAAAQAVREDGDGIAVYEQADLLYDKLRRLGSFVPLFTHHPEAGATKIYPVVPQDIGQLVRISRGIETFILKKIAGTP